MTCSKPSPGKSSNTTRGNIVLLLEGRLVEAVVRVDDLPRVQALAFINSLRGWLPERL